MYKHINLVRKASKNLQNALTVEYGTNSTYEHSHMLKIKSSSVKICESSRPLLAQNFSIKWLYVGRNDKLCVLHNM